MDQGAESYRRFLNGDDGGMTEIIRDYKDGLALFLTGITGDVLAAEELMEETFFRLLTKKPRFSGKSSFKTWLFSIGKQYQSGTGVFKTLCQSGKEIHFTLIVGTTTVKHCCVLSATTHQSYRNICNRFPRVIFNAYRYTIVGI